MTLTTSLAYGISVWSQSTTWDEFHAAAKLVENIGYDSVMTDDHLFSDQGSPHQPKFEALTTAAAWAATTSSVRIGHLVLANPFRNPTVLAKMSATIDHISHGRFFLGIGSAWFELEHRAYGIDFGSGDRERLDWLEESATLLRRLLSGESVTHDGPRYRAEELQLYPSPVQPRVPILIGGTGEKRTLRIVARSADIWHAGNLDPDTMRHKIEVLHRHCAAVGRDPSEIEIAVSPPVGMIIRDEVREATNVYRQVMFHNYGEEPTDVESTWAGPPELIAERFRPLLEFNPRQVIVDVPAPYDRETLERFIGEVKPLLAS